MHPTMSTMSTHVLAALLILSGVLPGAAAIAQPTEPPGLRKALTERMPGVKLGEIRAIPYFGGLYEVVANGLNVFYTDARGEIALMGELIDLASKRSLSQERLAQLRTIDFASLPLDRAIVKVKGNGSRRMALFSDPDCPFCRQLERELLDITDVTIYTFLLPIKSLHPDAVRKAELVWCASDRARAWDELMLTGREPDSAQRCDTPLAEVAQLADKLSISGTPGIIFGNGMLVPGAIKRAEIEQRLNAAAVAR